MKIINYDKYYSKEIPQLFTDTIHKTCNKDYTKLELNAWANPNIDYSLWEKRLEKTKPYLVIAEDKLVGFSEFYDDYIDCFYIHHECQGMGIGKFLLEYILSIAKNNNISKVKVDVSITAKPFFEKFRFKEVRKNIIKREDQTLINYIFGVFQ